MCMNRQQHSRTLVAFLNRDAARAATAVANFLGTPLPAWGQLMDENPEWLTLGTLNLLLDAAHEELDREPKKAYEIAKFVLRRVRSAETPPDAPVLLIVSRGRPWKEF